MVGNHPENQTNHRSCDAEASRKSPRPPCRTLYRPSSPANLQVPRSRWQLRDRWVLIRINTGDRAAVRENREHGAGAATVWECRGTRSSWRMWRLGHGGPTGRGVDVDRATLPRRVHGRPGRRRVARAVRDPERRVGLRRTGGAARPDGAGSLPEDPPRRARRRGRVPGDVPGPGEAGRLDPRPRPAGPVAARRCPASGDAGAGRGGPAAVASGSFRAAGDRGGTRRATRIPCRA